MPFTQSTQSNDVVSVPAESYIISLPQESPIETHAHTGFHLPDTANSKLSEVMYERNKI